MNKFLISMLRGMGVLPEIQKRVYAPDLVQANPPPQLRTEDFIKEPPYMNWHERVRFENTMPTVPQATTGPRG